MALAGKTVCAYKFIKEKGFVLYAYAGSSNDGIIKFPVCLNAKEVAPIVFKWLQSDEAEQVPCNGWDADTDHDGCNELG